MRPIQPLGAPWLLWCAGGVDDGMGNCVGERIFDEDGGGCIGAGKIDLLSSVSKIP